MKSILFSGYYGQRNVGDDAFCVVAAWGAQKYWGVRNIAFLSSAIPNMKTKAKAILPAKRLMKGQATLFGLFPSISADEIIYFGGSVFYRQSKIGSIRWIHEKLSGSIKKKKISAIGVSLGPFSTRRDYDKTREFLKNMSFLSLRDLRSYEIALEMKLGTKVVRAFDPAALLPLVNENGKENVSIVKEKKLIGISLCRYESFVGMNPSVEHNREQAIICGLKKFIRRHGDIILRFFIFNDHPVYSDEKVTHEVINALPEANIEIMHYSDDPCELLYRVAECQAFFAMRLHAAIFSFISAVPFALVEYHRKCTDFLDDIEYDNALRLEENICDSGRIETVLYRLIEISQGARVSLWDKVKKNEVLSLRNFQESPLFLQKNLA